MYEGCHFLSSSVIKSTEVSPKQKHSLLWEFVDSAHGGAV
jgi:hypothetical protein